MLFPSFCREKRLLLLSKKTFLTCILDNEDHIICIPDKSGRCIRNGALAQLARAPAWHAGGHRFESDMLHHPISRGPQSPRLLRASSFSAVSTSNNGVYGFPFPSLFRGKETAFGSRNGDGNHAFSPFVSIAVVISPRLFGYDMAGDLKRWRTRLFLPFLGFLKN